MFADSIFIVADIVAWSNGPIPYIGLKCGASFPSQFPHIWLFLICKISEFCPTYLT